MKILDFEQLDPQAVDELLEADRQAQEENEKDALAKRFEQRFEKRSWLEQHLPRRKKAQVLTFICHVVSGTGAAYAFFMLFNILVFGYLGAALAIGVIVLHEKEKRSWSDKFWDYYYAHKGSINWKALAVNATLFLISVGLTIGGAYYGIKDHMPGAEYMGYSNDERVVALQDELATAKTEKEAFKADKSNYTSDGKVYYKRLDTWSALEERVINLQNTLESQYGIVTVSNGEIKADWEQRRLFLVIMGLVICLISEVVFEWNMAFRSKYDYRIYLARKAMVENRKRKHAPTPNGQHVNGKKPLAPASN